MTSFLHDLRRLYVSRFRLTLRFVAVLILSLCPLALVHAADPADDTTEEETAAPAQPAEKPAAPAKKKIVEKSPVVFSMPTKIMHKALVQDLVRVGERLFLAGERGHIGWSDDNGKTWTQAKVPTLQDINSLFFVTQELGWAVGHDGNIFNTTDGGKTWAMQLDGLAYNLIRAKQKADKYKASFEAKQAELEQAEADLEAAQEAKKKNQAQIEKLEASIEELQEVVDELDFQVRDAMKILEDENAPWPLMDVWFADMNNGFAVGAFNAFLATSDGGKTWNDISDRIENPDGLHLNVIAGDSNTILVGGEGGQLFRSRDAGATWQKLESPDDGSFYAFALIHAESGAPEIWTAGLEGMVFHSTNGGDDWEPVEHGAANNLNGLWVDSATGLILIVGNDGAVVRSTDGGKTFESHRRIDQSTMSSVAVAPNGDYVYAGSTGISIVKAAEFQLH